MVRRVFVALLIAGSGAILWGQPLQGVTRVKIEGVLVHRLDPEKPVVPVSEQYNPTTGRGPFLALFPGGDVECLLASSDPESILSKRFGLALPPFNNLDEALDSLGFAKPQTRIDFWGVNHGGRLVFDSYNNNGWLWLSGSATRFAYQGSETNPAVWGALNEAESDGAEPQAPFYTWDFIEDKVAGNGDNRACSPPRAKGPEGKFVVLVERGDCLFYVKAQNAALAGASGVVIYDSAASEVFPGSYIVTPGASIPSVFLRRADGLELLKQIQARGEGKGGIVLWAANLIGTLGGWFGGQEPKLSLMLTEMSDYMFLGTLTPTDPVPAQTAQTLRKAVGHATRVEEPRPQRRARPLEQ